MIITGKVVDKGGAKTEWQAYKVVCDFTQTVDVVEGTTVNAPTESSFDVANDGSFSITLPGKKQIVDPVSVKVLAPAGEVLNSTDFSGDALAKDEESKTEIKLEVVPQPQFEILSSDDPFLGTRPKLTGRVLDYEGVRLIANRQVLLFGLPLGAVPAGGVPKDSDFVPVSVTRTDAQGYFTADYPRLIDPDGNPGAPLQFAQAFAVVAEAKDVGGNSAIKITLTKWDKYNGVFPRSVILVVKVDDNTLAGGSTECDCSSMVPRAVDGTDLTTSPSSFSSDLGTGKCVNLTIPNRALEEFSYYAVVRTTDPDIRGVNDPVRPVGPDVIRGIESISKIAALPRLMAATGEGGTAVLAIRKKATTAAISPNILAAHLAAPGATVEAAIQTAAIETARIQSTQALKWSYHLYPGRGPLTATNPIVWDGPDTNFYEATTIAHGHLLHFKQVWRADGYSLGDLLYSLPLAPCQKKQIAVVDWERREAAMRTEQLQESEGLTNLLSRDRDISEIVTTSLQEHMRGNSNSLTFGTGSGSGAAGNGQYGAYSFGGVAAMAVGAGVSSANASQDASRDLAANYLQTIHDTTFQSASAVRNQRSTVIQTVAQGEAVTVTTEVVANHNHCHAMTIEYFEVLRHFQVSQELADVRECLFVPLQLSYFDNRKALRWRDILTAFLRKPQLAPGFDAIERIENGYDGVNFPDGTYADDLVRFLEGTLLIVVKTPTGGSEGIFAQIGDAISNFFAGSSPTKPPTDTSLQFNVLTGSGQQTLPVEFTLVSDFAANVPLTVGMRSVGPLPVLKRSDITEVILTWGQSTDFPPDTQMMIKSGSMRYRTDHIHHNLFSDPAINAGYSQQKASVDTPLDAEELRNPKKEDLVLSRKLIQHLNEHVEYYHKAIWWNMDPDRRYMLLDGFIAPNANGRSVASVVENRLIGFAGNSMILPVAPGSQLDPSYTQDSKNPVDLINQYAPTSPIPPMRVSVPTRGVFAEAVMGACNSCEQKEETRFWRWDEAPCGDEPTPIQSPSTDSRQSPDPNLTAKDFPTPMINIQNAPVEPDPTGLAAALKVIGTPNLFRDITGLDQTQKNSLAAMQSALDAAKFFGGEASKLAQQAGMKQGGIDKSLQSIQQAQKSGLINQDQANDLSMGALRSLVSGSPDAKKNLTDDPAVKDTLTSAAAKPDSKVSVKRGDESVDVQSSDTPAAADSTSVSNALTLAAASSLPSGLKLRKKHSSMTAAEWTAFRQAITKAKADPVAYKKYVDIHARTLAAPGLSWGVHTLTDNGGMLISDGRNFFAWHREMLARFETDLGVALPYWDWTADPTIPADLSNAADLTTWGVTRGAPDPNVTLSTASDVTSALSRTNFLDFQSVIEFRVHNPAHMFVAGMGGDMGSIATSVKDPMFWLIHAYIDNLWELWQIRQKRAVNPANMGEQLQPAPITRRVSEVLRADSLGYTYEGLPSVALVPTTSNVVFA